MPYRYLSNANDFSLVVGFPWWRSGRSALKFVRRCRDNKGLGPSMAPWTPARRRAGSPRRSWAAWPSWNAASSATAPRRRWPSAGRRAQGVRLGRPTTVPPSVVARISDERAAGGDVGSHRRRPQRRRHTHRPGRFQVVPEYGGAHLQARSASARELGAAVRVEHAAQGRERVPAGGVVHTHPLALGGDEPRRT